MTKSTCGYCGVELQSKTATACIRCMDLATMKCPECHSTSGRVLWTYMECDPKTGEKLRACPTCKGDGFITRSPDEMRKLREAPATR